MPRFRPPTDQVEIPTELYDPFEGYSEDAEPDQDERREQLDEPAEPLERVEPEPEHDPDELVTERELIPHAGRRVERQPTDNPERAANDAMARTARVGDVPQTILPADPQRTSWVFWIPETSAAGIRFALGRHAAQDAAEDHSSVPLVTNDGTVRGTFTGPIAARTDTPGTVAEVHVLAERDTLR